MQPWPAAQLLAPQASCLTCAGGCQLRAKTPGHWHRTGFLAVQGARLLLAASLWSVGLRLGLLWHTRCLPPVIGVIHCEPTVNVDLSGWLGAS